MRARAGLARLAQPEKKWLDRKKELRGARMSWRARNTGSRGCNELGSRFSRIQVFSLKRSGEPPKCLSEKGRSSRAACRRRRPCHLPCKGPGAWAPGLARSPPHAQRARAYSAQVRPNAQRLRSARTATFFRVAPPATTLSRPRWRATSPQYEPALLEIAAAGRAGLGSRGGPRGSAWVLQQPTKRSPPPMHYLPPPPPPLPRSGYRAPLRAQRMTARGAFVANGASPYPRRARRRPPPTRRQSISSSRAAQSASALHLTPSNSTGRNRVPDAACFRCCGLAIFRPTASLPSPDGFAAHPSPHPLSRPQVRHRLRRRRRLLCRPRSSRQNLECALPWPFRV